MTQSPETFRPPRPSPTSPDSGGSTDSATDPGLVALARRFATERMADCPAWVLVTQLFIGLGWNRSAVAKIIDTNWWNGDALSGFLASQSGRAVGWYQPLLDLVVGPHLMAISVLVIVAQLFAGASLITGKALQMGLAVGMFLNLNFVATGAVNPSAFYLLAQGSIALWLAERTTTRRTGPQLEFTSIVGTVLVAASLPWVRTLAPNNVIEDPAIMLVTAGVLTVVGSETALGRARADTSSTAAILTGFRRRILTAVAAAAVLIGGAGIASAQVDNDLEHEPVTEAHSDLTRDMLLEHTRTGQP